MKLTWEEPGETNHELIYGTVGLVCVLIGVLLPLDRMLTAAGHRCPLRSLTGIPCPSCGATRAVAAAGRLELGRAFSLNPLAAACFVALWVYVPLALGSVVLGTRRPRLRQIGQGGRLAMVFGGMLLVLANWAYLIVFLPEK